MQTPDDATLAYLGLTPDDIGDKKFYYGKGCEQCNNTGYKGRIGLFEIMSFNDEIRDLVMKQAVTGVLREAARKTGMILLRENGLNFIYNGITTIEEVIKETIAAEEV